MNLKNTYSPVPPAKPYCVYASLSKYGSDKCTLGFVIINNPAAGVISRARNLRSELEQRTLEYSELRDIIGCDFVQLFNQFYELARGVEGMRQRGEKC
jgi:hypothetical protein